MTAAKSVARLTAYLSDQLAKPPLETIAKLCATLPIRDETIRAIFDNYDRFLGILDHHDKREELERAQNHDELRASTAWIEIREISHPFHDGLVNLFLRDDDQLRQLAMRYGVF